jgi:hypothetical protein
MTSRSQFAQRAGAAAFFLAFTNHCGPTQPSSDQSSVTTEAQANAGASGTPAGAVGGAGAAVAQPRAAAQGSATASPSGPMATTAQSVGAAGSGTAGSAARSSMAADGGATAATQAGAGGSVVAGAGGGSGSAALPVTTMAWWPPVTDFSVKGAFTSVTENNTGPMS